MAITEQAELEGMKQIKEGGAALTAYARLMYESLSESRRYEVKMALLQYCELDTLAMVFLYQGLTNFIAASKY